MYYTREQHKRFLDRELQAISENYIRVLNTKAIALLSENEIYVAQFMKVGFEKDPAQEDAYKGSGQVILKFKKELYTIISEHSHTPYEKVYKDSDRNYWMTAEEAKEYGMIDEVLIRKK